MSIQQTSSSHYNTYHINLDTNISLEMLFFSSLVNVVKIPVKIAPKHCPFETPLQNNILVKLLFKYILYTFLLIRSFLENKKVWSKSEIYRNWVGRHLQDKEEEKEVESATNCNLVPALYADAVVPPLTLVPMSNYIARSPPIQLQLN